MELPASGYFFTLAQLSIAFVGFGTIVVSLRQGTGKKLSPFHVMLTKVFIELGIMAAGFGLLAPTLALGGFAEITTWRISSGIIVVILAPWLIFYLIRRKAATQNEKFPPRVHVMMILGCLVLAAACLNTVGIPINPGPLPVAAATVYVLSFASVAFLATYNAFLKG